MVEARIESILPHLVPSPLRNSPISIPSVTQQLPKSLVSDALPGRARNRVPIANWYVR